MNNLIQNWPGKSLILIGTRVEESLSWHGKAAGKSVTFSYNSSQIFTHYAFYFGIFWKNCAFNNKN